MIKLPPRYIPLPASVVYAHTVPSELKDFFGKLYGLAWESHYKYTPQLAVDDILDSFGIRKSTYYSYVQALERMSWLRSETHRNGCVRFEFAERFTVPSKIVTIQDVSSDVPSAPGGALIPESWNRFQDSGISAVVVEEDNLNSNLNLTTTATTELTVRQVLQAAGNLFGSPIIGKEQDYQPLAELLAWVAYANDTRGTTTKSPGGFVYWVFHAGKGLMRLPDKYRHWQDYLPASFLLEIGIQPLPVEEPAPEDMPAPDGDSGPDWLSPLIERHGPINTSAAGLSAAKAFAAVLSQLEYEMPKATYDQYVRDLGLVGYHDETVYLAAGDEFTRQWIDGRLNSTITRLFAGLLNYTVQVKIVSPEAIHD